MVSRKGLQLVNAARAAGAAFILGAAMSAAGTAAAQDPEPPLLRVTGLGEVSVAPDMATLRLGVQEEAKSAAAASAAMSEATSRVLSALQEAGVPEADITTGRLRLDPRYSDGTPTAPPRVTGFVAEIGLSVEVRDLDALGGILDAVISVGANRLDGIGFDLADRSAALAEARRAAVADARDRAQTYAGAADIALGEILSLTEGASRAGPQPMAMESRAFSDMSVPAGEITISAEVTMTWSLQP